MKLWGNYVRWSINYHLIHSNYFSLGIDNYIVEIWTIFDNLKQSLPELFKFQLCVVNVEHANKKVYLVATIIYVHWIISSCILHFFVVVVVIVVNRSCKWIMESNNDQSTKTGDSRSPDMNVGCMHKILISHWTWLNERQYLQKIAWTMLQTTTTTTTKKRRRVK